MGKQLLLDFDHFRHKWIKSISKKQKRSITEALKKMMISYLKEEIRKEKKDAKPKD